MQDTQESEVGVAMLTSSAEYSIQWMDGRGILTCNRDLLEVAKQVAGSAVLTFPRLH